MKYLADTDVLIDHIRGNKYLDGKYLEDGLVMSIISLAELLYGAYGSNNIQKSLQKVSALLNLGIKIENLDDQIVDKYARFKVELEQRGQKLDEFDLLIAATAKVNDLIVITRNLNHFNRIEGLKLI